ncbi:hypothetical protein IWX47DRAFT_114531 [Phyllosticta citricarpa]
MKWKCKARCPLPQLITSFPRLQSSRRRCRSTCSVPEESGHMQGPFHPLAIERTTSSPPSSFFHPSTISFIQFVPRCPIYSLLDSIVFLPQSLISISSLYVSGQGAPRWTGLGWIDRRRWRACHAVEMHCPDAKHAADGWVLIARHNGAHGMEICAQHCHPSPRKACPLQTHFSSSSLCLFSNHANDSNATQFVRPHPIHSRIRHFDLAALCRHAPSCIHVRLDRWLAKER